MAYSYYAHDSGWASRRAMVFVGIVIIHLLMIWAFASGLAHRVIAQMTQDVKVNIIDVQKKDEKPPPPPKQDLEKPPPVQVPPPIVNIQIPVEAPQMVVTDKPLPPLPPRPVTATVPGTPIRQAHPIDPQNYYPAQSQRAEEAGLVVISFCVTAAGKLDGEPEVATSSGFARLDGAGIQLVKDQSKWIPGTQEGKPVRSCTRIPVRFKFTN